MEGDRVRAQAVWTLASLRGGVWNHTSVLMPTGRLEIFVSFMKAAREQVGGSRWQRDSGVGRGGWAERTLG